MSESPSDGDESVEASELPFAEYEISVEEANNPDEWVVYHPVASSQERAEEKARDKAQINGFDTPVVESVTGPYEPTAPVTVQTEEMKNIAEALGLPSDILEDNRE